MKRLTTLALAIGIFAAASLLNAQEAAKPLVTISVQNHLALVKAATRLVNTVDEGRGDSLDQEFKTFLGSPDLAGVDSNRPWQIALWFKGMGVPPVIATYVPVTDFAAFEKGLQPGNLLRGSQSQNQVLSVGGHAIVLYRKDTTATVAASDLIAVRSWAKSVPQKEARTVHLHLAMDDAVRMQVSSTLAFGKLMLGQTFSNPQSAPPGGLNPAAMMEMIGLYFQAIEGTVQGLDQLHLEAEVTQESLSIYKRVVPLAKTELAQWLEPGTESLTTLVPYLNPDAPLAFAMRFGAGPGALDFMKKAVQLGFQVQNQAEDEKVVQRTDELMRAMLPMKFAGSIGFEDGYRFSGVYEIPGGNTPKVYGQLLDWLTFVMEKQVGKDKMYSSFDLKRAERRIGDTAIDRAIIGINMDSPAFQTPQQKEVFEKMWPGGKMEIQYALQGNRLHMAAGGQIEDVLKTSDAPRALGVDPETAMMGHVNLVALLKGTLASNPLLPPHMQAKFRQLDPKGLEIPFKVNVDGQLKSESHIPLKLISAFGQLQ